MRRNGGPGQRTPGSFMTDDGLRLAALTWTPAVSAVGLPPVLLHHGFASSAAANYERPGLVSALLSAGRTVVALDARGHGESDKPHDPARYGERRMSLDLRGLADHLALAEYDLVGYSMGAIVCLLAACVDHRVRRLVVGGVGAATVEAGGVDTRAVPPGELAAALRAPSSDGMPPSLAVFRSLAEANGADLAALAAHADAIGPLTLALADITAATLVLAGDRDPLAARPEVLADAIPDGRAQSVPGNHFSAVLRPAFAALTVAFLSEP